MKMCFCRDNVRVGTVRYDNIDDYRFGGKLERATLQTVARIKKIQTGKKNAPSETMEQIEFSKHATYSIDLNS